MARSAAGRAALRFRGAAGAARRARREEPPPAAAQETAPKAAQETAPKTAQGDGPQDAALVDGLRDIDRAAAALSRKTRVISVMDLARRTASRCSTSTPV